jgi:Peptidase family M28
MIFLPFFTLACTPLLAQETQEPESQKTVAEAAVEVTFESMIESITVDDLQSHVDFLAGPETRGRGTLTPGFDKAAEYVEAQLRSYGLEPMGPEGSYRLPIELQCAVASSKAFFKVTDSRGKDRDLILGVDFMPIPGSPGTAITGDSVFVGFAIDARKEKWQDLPRKSVSGKVVFAFTREPYADNAKSKRFDGLAATDYSSLQTKAREVKSAGGIALVLVPDPGLFADEAGPIPNLTPMPLWPGFSSKRLGAIGGTAVPVLSVSRKVASEIFATDLDKYYLTILKKKKAKLIKAKGKSEVSFQAAFADASVPAYNLAARIKGSDGDGEVVVVGAHLDHVGFNHLTDKGKMRVHPGADDNASGSAALLEVAQAMAGGTPKKDILFLWFCGEENGLLGSRAYCAKPVYPHDKTVVMLNMDQIARTDPKEMNIGGLWELKSFGKLIKKLSKRISSPLKLDLDSGRELYSRSDQYSFFSKKVPGIFFFEGNINDNPVYHKPGDVAETIHTDKVMWVARLFAATAWSVAWEGQRP